MIEVLFVCLGNICRSPMAEAVFRHKVKEAGLQDRIGVDSAGTGDWHIGKGPHRGTVNMLKRHNINAEGLVARQVSVEDFDRFDYVIVMDRANLEDIRRLGRGQIRGELRRMLDFLPEREEKDVPDPYFTGNFEEVYELIEQSCGNLLEYIRGREKL